MKSLIAAGLIATSWLAFAGPFEKAELRGVTDKEPVSYTVGEPIDFTLTLTNAEFEPSATSALRYYDCVNMARRIAGEVNVTRAGLGDYVSPPSGITLFYNNLVQAKAKKIAYVQGSRHGYIPPKADRQEVR